jgi:hypothetical protein
MKLVLSGVAFALVAGFLAGWLLSGRAGSGDRECGAAAVRTGSEQAGTGPIGPPGGGIGSGTGTGTGTGDPLLAPAHGNQAGGEARAVQGEGGMCVCDAPVARACAPQDKRIAELEAQVERGAKAREHDREGPRDRYDGVTAAERRAQAAQQGNLRLEFPDWREEAAVRPEAVDKYGLTPGEKSTIEQLYQQFVTALRGDLLAIYGDMMGDPDAGQGLMLNSLIHEIVRLSPQEPCSQRRTALLAVMAQGQPLPPPPAEVLPCEAAMRAIFARVDALEQAVLAALGERGRGALWSGSSVMEFGSGRK